MYEYGARLVRVVDADTVRLDVDLGFTLWRTNDSYRLLRINAPELSTPEGKAARAALESRLGVATRLTIQTQRSDSFGRWLAELYADGENISDWLVANGFAAYHSY